MNTLHARDGRIIPKLPIYEYPHETFLKNTSMVIHLFTRTKNFDAKFCFSKVESLVVGGGRTPPPPSVIWRITILLLSLKFIAQYSMIRTTSETNKGGSMNEKR